MRPDQVDDASDHARPVAVIVVIMLMITMSVVIMSAVVGTGRRSVAHGRQHARYVTLQHIDNNHQCADASVLQSGWWWNCRNAAKLSYPAQGRSSDW
jgi:hypothetical protein